MATQSGLAEAATERVLTLPAYLLVPRHFEHWNVPGETEIPVLDEDGLEMARVHCERRDKKRWLRVIPVYETSWIGVTRGGELVLEAVYANEGPTLLRNSPGLEVGPGDGETYVSVAEFDPFGCPVRDRSKRLGTINGSMLFNTFEVIRGRGVLCKIRPLRKRAWQELTFDVPRGKAVYAFESSKPGAQIDIHFLPAFIYMLMLRNLTR